MMGQNIHTGLSVFAICWCCVKKINAEMKEDASMIVILELGCI